MVPRSGLQHAAVTSYGYKLQCLRIQVRQIARERDKARLDLEKVERCCLQLGRELDEQYVALEHTQRKLKDVQAEIEAKELLLQQAINHQAKLEADARFLQGKEDSLQGRLNHTMKENTQLQNKVTEMAEKLAASEKLVLELQKELNCVAKDKLVESHSPELPNQNECFAEIVLEYERQCQVLWDQNRVLWRELERLRLQLRECRAERGLPGGGLSSQGSSLRACRSPSPLVPTSACTETSPSMEQLQEQLRDLKVQLETKSEKSKGEVSHLNVKVCQLGRELGEHKASHGAGPGTLQRQSQRLAEAERLRGAEAAIRLEHHQQHAACWMETELLRQQLKTLQEKLLEAKASLSLAQTRHALQLQQAKTQMSNMVPKKQFEQLQNSLREEQCKAQQLQENLHHQAEQTCRQLVRTQEEHERLLQAAVEQAEGLEHNLRSAEALLAERAAQLKDTQAQLSRNKLLIKDLCEENRGFAVALQAAELKQKSTEEKNQLLEEQASALKQLIGKITPASLSG
ncbi:ninein-like protein isoform X5 [Rissa tridactyla]|uniref:ninein-like protein isoform X5 n=1 Tax=Rissa tridactyla TaxID=75485 RepID=UPI0023BB07D8|nr:ninein-like protein isoform X5 [Rissa tridactyla]